MSSKSRPMPVADNDGHMTIVTDDHGETHDTDEAGATPTQHAADEDEGSHDPTARPPRSPRSRAKTAQATHQPQTAHYSGRRPRLLDAPPPRPGMVQRWLSVSTVLGGDRTIGNKFNHEGWLPRDPSTMPAEAKPVTMAHGSDDAGVVKRGDLILCEMSQEQFDRMRRAPKREQDERQRRAITEAIAGAEDPRLGRIQQQRRDAVTYGKRRPGGDFADD